MIIKEYQEFKPVQRALGLKADGMPGPKTLAAVALKLRCHEIWSAVQAAVNVTPDGIPGPATARGIAAPWTLPCPGPGLTRQPSGPVFPFLGGQGTKTTLFLLSPLILYIMRGGP